MAAPDEVVFAWAIGKVLLIVIASFWHRALCLVGRN